MDKRQEVTKNIALMVKASSKTQVQIAREMGVHSTTITDYISGKSFPTLLGFIKLCEVLNCRYEDILGRLE